MPLKEPDAEDPLELNAVSVPVADGSDADAELMATFAEEFVRMGWPGERVLATFRTPFYAGVHRAWRVLGEERSRRILGEVLAQWRPADPLAAAGPDPVHGGGWQEPSERVATAGAPTPEPATPEND